MFVHRYNSSMCLQDYQVNHSYSEINQEEDGYANSDFLLHSTVLYSYTLLAVNYVNTHGISPCARIYREHAETNQDGDLWITHQMNFENETNTIKATRPSACCHQTRSMIDQCTKRSNPGGVE